MFRDLEYQSRVVSTLDTYLDVLKTKKKEADEVEELAATKPHLKLPVPDFAKEAWDAMKAADKLPHSRTVIPFSPRIDGCERPVPNIVLKVPTGGGKTWLAVSAVSRVMGHYLDRNTGFVLWIVPNEAIYTQTLKHLKDRQHPYRQALDRAAAGRVKIMEKTDVLDARDVGTNLCVMLLMLQSANRETQDSLKMFRDRGDVHGFFPPEGEQQAHQAALARTPNLDAYEGMFPMVKDSLGNALRIIRPMVVLDEGHRAISDLAFRTLYGFNPCFVLELTATPLDVQPRGGKNPREARYANVLVEITGRDLDREGMIKMPLNLDPRQGTDWKSTLNAALDRLKSLDRDARKLKADTGRYIRPIMLIQVERTGTDQRSSKHIHAEDVKDWLLTAGFDAAEIAIKTAEQNDLNQPENQDLLSPTNRIRAIITKQALQEGWDCPFAYVLCALAASSNLNAMTQLIGRILRQPGALKTGIGSLDECHVITHHAKTADVVDAIKDGLEQDGLGDLVLQVSQEDSKKSGKGSRKIKRRAAFSSHQIFLPKVLLVDGDGARDLDYETDVLSRIDWRGYDPKDIAARIPENAQAAESQLQRIRLADDGDELLVGEAVAANSEVLAFDPAHAVRMISDIVLNPFVGREIVGRLLSALRRRSFDDAKLGSVASLIVEELRKGLDQEQTARAEVQFKAGVAAGHIQFRLRLDGQNWQMPFETETTQPEGARQLVGKDGGPLQRSLFAPMYENDFNIEERDVAVYLDGDAALSWWHRNVARSQYAVQGWRKAKIYPDFIFAVSRRDGSSRITVLETKGDQLDNLDTAYKREVLNFMSKNFEWDSAVPAGTLELVKKTGETVDMTLILMSEWKAKLPTYLKP
ncbi:DEAD/DEAH box helicase [Bradyrhizobium elkanii]|jgi:type III restriction enzyme|uniref:DEAD/DEAH box helicase n=1 Tax=Bradyrhizobium elkanii TaxID=29448 RepID=UPI001AEA8FBE|nr:DEAD/DEAH box helicase family protein [Bradyrhizobium elkanii]MBP2431501.1 type III restriction enzyme [Bradyrhizobium elkanii]WLA91218.1 DEAD/DEAH box helicase family protein [Bradyrhizobium elkanii]